MASTICNLRPSHRGTGEGEFRQAADQQSPRRGAHVFAFAVSGDCDDDGRKRDPERYAQIHSGTLDQYIANFDAVRETLSGHPVFGPYLDPLEPTRKRLEKHLAPKVALFDGSESRFRLNYCEAESPPNLARPARPPSRQ